MEKNTRLIFHLSYPQGKNSWSVNANTLRNICSVEYPTFDEAVQLCIAAGRNCHISKSDMTSAFHILGVKKAHWPYLVMMAISPTDNKTYYFVDKCLPFGASISCLHFQKVSDVIAHLVHWQTNRDLINYLDDFFFAALLRAICNQQVQAFLDVCDEIRFPVSMEKTFWGTTLLLFLGLLINMVAQMVLIPTEKIAKARELIESVISRKSITVKQLQKICGFLNFIGWCIVPGRAFTRRMYMVLQGREHLKSHHHLRISAEIHADLSMWLWFVNHPSIYCRSFLDFSNTLEASEICMYSDASKNAKLRFGGICNKSWMYQQWDPSFIEQEDPSIEYLELYAVLATVLNWLHRFQNSQIILFCNNQSVVAMINNTTSSCPNCLILIRELVLHSLCLNVRVFAKYVPSKQNKQADYLSRLRISDFNAITPNHDEEPTEVPSTIWPMQKMWCNKKFGYKK